MLIVFLPGIRTLNVLASPLSHPSPPSTPIVVAPARLTFPGRSLAAIYTDPLPASAPSPCGTPLESTCSITLFPFFCLSSSLSTTFPICDVPSPERRPTFAHPCYLPSDDGSFFPEAGSWGFFSGFFVVVVFSPPVCFFFFWTKSSSSFCGVCFFFFFLSRAGPPVFIF